MVKCKLNVITRMHFTVFDSDGVTPLTGQAGTCTDSLLKNGASAGETVTIVEIGVSGHYDASFTPTSIGVYDLEITCPDNRVNGEVFEVETNLLDDIVTEVNANETKIDTIQGNVTSILIDTGTTIPGTITTIQTDLDNPNQYKADVSALATETNATSNKNAVIAEIDVNEGKIDTIISDIAGLNNITVAQIWDYLLTSILTAGSIGLLLKTNINTTISSRAVPNEYDTELSNIQTDLDNPNQYKANVSALATESNATSNKNSIITEIDANETKIDTVISDIASLNNITVADVWDYLLTSILTNNSIGKLIKDNLDQKISTTESNIRGSDNDDLKDISTQLDTVQSDLDNPDQYKADVSSLATETNATANKTTIITEIDQNEVKIDSMITTLAIVTSSLTDIETKINRIKGLVHENVYHKSITYNAGNEHVSSVVEIYDTPTSATAHNGTGLISTYNLTIERSAGRIISILMTGGD